MLMFNITNYCEIKDIYLNIKTPPTSKNNNFIQYFVEQIKDIYSKKDSETIYRDLLEREEICSTVIGNSIAVPHCRSDINCPPILKIFRPKEPCFCSSKDPIKLFFLMVLPLYAKNEHLIILSKIVKLGKNKEWVEQLLDSPSREVFYKHLQNIDKNLSQH